MDYKTLSIGTRIEISQFQGTIIGYDVMKGYSGLFPVYVTRLDGGETEPIHHTDITGLVYDYPLEIEVIEARKAYYAEHGDDAPEPTPQPKPVTTFEQEWPKWEGGYEGSFCRLCNGNDCTATRQRLEISDDKVYIHVQTQCFDCGQELHDAHTEYILEEMVKDLIRLPLELTTANADLKTARRMHKGAESNVDYWQRQFKQVEAERDTARAAQDQLRDELTAVTAVRDKYKTRYEELHAERRLIWDMVMRANSEWQLTNDLYELMK